MVKPEIKYCSFIDVLGYKGIVEATDKTIDQKVKILESVYMNMFSSISAQLKMIRHNQVGTDKLFVKSFSDCIYLESDEPSVLLFALHSIFNVTLGYNSNFDQQDEYTPLLRSGTIKDWVLRFMDIGSLVRQPSDTIYKNDDFNNPVGLGVARAYLTSEATGLSGMRVIISKEVFDDLKTEKFDKVSFECYSIDCKNFLKQEGLTKTYSDINLFFTPVIGKDKEGNPIHLYEMCWPVYSYSWSDSKSDIGTMIKEFFKIKARIPEKELRHSKGTAEVLLKSLIITAVLHPPNDLNKLKPVITELQKISETNYDL